LGLGPKHMIDLELKARLRPLAMTLLGKLGDLAKSRASDTSHRETSSAFSFTLYKVFLILAKS